MVTLALVLVGALREGRLVALTQIGKAIKVKKRPFIGVDLGTTNSVVAVSDNGKAEVLPLGASKTGLLPSLLGKDLQLLPQMKDRCFHDFKNFMEKPLDELASGVTPLSLTTAMCRHIKAEAEKVIKEEVGPIVLTVPARFSDKARKATKEAAKTAGFQVVRLLNEPTAAALAYGLNKDKEGVYLVYDLGGGTFDVTLLRIQRRVFQILGTTGDLFLGGYTIDQDIVRRWGKDPNDPEWLLRAKRIKERLSAGAEEDDELPSYIFEEIVQKSVGRTIAILRELLADAQVTPSDIQGVLLVGGSTRLPQVSKALAGVFGEEKIHKSLDPDRAVAMGAALHAEALMSHSITERPLLLDVIPASLGIETVMGYVENILPRYTPTPVRTQVQFSTIEDNQTAVLIHVVQGDSLKKDACVSLGQFILKGIPPQPKGKPKINISFEVDEDGILTVQAEELLSGQKHQLVLEEYFT